MEIESFWKNLPPFKTIEKGSNGKFGYGYWRKKGIELGDKRNHKRQCLRQIRKYGFTRSETWGLDVTIMRWLSDTYGGFFRIAGPTENWNEYDENGKYYDYYQYRSDDNYWKLMHQAQQKRYQSYKTHLQDFLDNATPEQKKEIANFCCPRLRLLAKVIHGWPSTDDFPKFEDWQKEIYNMADKFEQGTYSPYFISYFFSLWD